MTSVACAQLLASTPRAIVTSSAGSNFSRASGCQLAYSRSICHEVNITSTYVANKNELLQARASPLVGSGLLSLRKRGDSKPRASFTPSVVCSVAVQAPITFHIGETSLTLPFSAETARAVDAAIGKLLQTFKEKEKATRPQRWEAMDFKHKGGDDGGAVVVEVFCNPNAYSNAFQAKVLITVKGDQIKFASEGPLSAIKADIDEYLAAHA